MVKRFRFNKNQEWLMILLMHCEFTGYYGSLTSLTRRIATWNIPLTGYYKRLPLGAVLTNCIADHGKDGKNVKSDCLIVWQQSHNQLGYLLISYHYSASLVHGPLVNPLQYHIIGSGAGGGGAGEATAPPSENEREVQPLPPPLTDVYVCFKALWSATSARAI